MSDDTVHFNAGGGGDKASADLIDNVKHLRVKMQSGIPGEVDDVSSVNPMPIFNSNSFDFFFEVRKGNVVGHAIADVAGRNPAVGSGAQEDLWDPGGTLVDALVGERLKVSSTDANDTIAGTGAQIIRIKYLDTSYVRKSTDVELDGLSDVLTSVSDILRRESIEVIQAGDTDENLGQINVVEEVSDAVRGAILVGENVTLDGHYTAPAGVTAYVVGTYEEINKNEDVIFRYKATRGDNGIFRSIFISALYQMPNPIDFTAASEPMVEKTDFKITAISTNTDASPAMFIVICEVDN